MASLIWTSIFLLLCVEIVLTAILVIPVPRKIRNYIAKEIFQFSIGDKLSKPILFVGVALTMALIESYFAHERIVQRIQEGINEGGGGGGGHGGPYGHGYGDHMHSHVGGHFHDRERKYKTERNMYLTGFALTLLFVIGRITQLMQESVELESEISDLQGGGGKETTDKNKKTTTATTGSSSAGDKKKD